MESSEHYLLNLQKNRVISPLQESNHGAGSISYMTQVPPLAPVANLPFDGWKDMHVIGPCCFPLPG